MSNYLDLTSWSRREVFEFYLGFDKPYFNICTRLDVTKLVALVRRREDLNVSLAYHYFALRVANEIEPFRYRLRDGKVFVHDVIHGGTTVLLPNESFNFAYFDYVEDFQQFIADAGRNVAAVRAANPPLKSKEGDDRIYFTTLPWISFTSFSHARNWHQEDSIPRIAFGKFVEENERTFLPMSVEVHHALVDGLQVGRFVMRLEELLERPEDYMGIDDRP